MGDTVRAFVAAAVDQRARDELGRLCADLRGAAPRWVRWVSAESAHLTLRFLGETPTDTVSRLSRALEEVAGRCHPFSLGLGGTGAFPSVERPRVVWVGLTGDLEALSDLQRGVEAVAVAAGFPPERRAFQPHLTLGRVRDGTPPAEARRLGAAVREAGVARDVRWRVDHLALVRSTLLPDGARYDILATAGLA